MSISVLRDVLIAGDRRVTKGGVWGIIGGGMREEGSGDKTMGWREKSTQDPTVCLWQVFLLET